MIFTDGNLKRSVLKYIQKAKDARKKRISKTKQMKNYFEEEILKWQAKYLIW